MIGVGVNGKVYEGLFQGGAVGVQSLKLNQLCTEIHLGTKFKIKPIMYRNPFNGLFSLN